MEFFILCLALYKLSSDILCILYAPSNSAFTLCKFFRGKRMEKENKKWKQNTMTKVKGTKKKD